jgi:hypothetical protein
MKTARKSSVIVLGLTIIAFMGGSFAMAATNQATDPGGGGVTLTASGNVTVNSSALQLVKQVWTTAGTCLASAPADATCNGSATTATVPASTQLKFVIFVKNATSIALTDVRFQDLLDITAGTGFTYVAGTLKYDVSQLDTATSAQIYTAVDAGTAETDAVDTGAGHYASVTSAGNTATITIGAVTGQANQTLSVNANRTFALEFQASKN